MWRFILLTFALLGVAFYELSGGSEFEVAERATSPEVKATPLVSTRSTPVKTLPEPTAKARKLTTTTPVAASVTLASVDMPTATRNPDQAFFAVIGDAPERARPKPVAQQAVLADDGTADLSKLDLRIVAKPRVNMRGGPGTQHEVVAKLGRGAEVEVLQDNGDGWVKLEVLGTGEIGWMADFLLTAAN